MFNTLRVKIVIFTLSFLLLLSFVLTISGFIHFANAKQLLMISYDFTISSFAERIDKDIVKLTNNAKDLALMGSVLYKTRNVSDKNFMSNQIPKFVITNIFENYNDSYIANKTAKTFFILCIN